MLNSYKKTTYTAKILDNATLVLRKNRDLLNYLCEHQYPE